jgi:hypothetical protein
MLFSFFHYELIRTSLIADSGKEKFPDVFADFCSRGKVNLLATNSHKGWFLSRK